RAARPGPPGPPPPLAGQADPLAVDHPGRDGDLVAALPVRPGPADPAPAAPVGLFDGQLELGLLVGPGHRPGRPAAPKQAAEQVLQVDVVEALATDEDLLLGGRPAA